MNHRDDGRSLSQAPMDSPLNSAHTFSRKADMLAKNKNYEEAIVCHRKAADFLLQAMNSDPTSPLIGSLALQHKAYLAHIDRLHIKCQYLGLKNNNIKVFSSSTQTDNTRDADAPKQDIDCDEETICQILRENDDMMKRISFRSTETPEKQSNHKITCPVQETYPKNSEGDKDNASSCSLKPHSVDEIAQLNHRLSNAVRSLLKELGSVKAEKKLIEEYLKTNLEKSQKSEGLTFSSLSLPPLEDSYPELAEINPQI